MTTRKPKQPVAGGRDAATQRQLDDYSRQCQELREELTAANQAVEHWQRKYTEAEGAAAADHGEREPQTGPRSTAAPGSPSLRWIAEPTRAGWWWFRADGRKATPLRVINGAWITSDAEMRWLEVVDGYSLTLNQHAEQNPGGWWAGPIEPPKVPDEEPTANIVLSNPEFDK